MTYLGACAGVLYGYFLRESEPEAAIAFGWLIMLVTIPAGFLVSLVLGKTFGLAEVAVREQVLGLWMTSVVLGYLQWFLVVPWLWRRRHRVPGAPGRGV